MEKEVDNPVGRGFRQDKSPDGRGGSHQGMKRASDALGTSDRLTGRHFCAKRVNRGNCALCYLTRGKNGGEKQTITFCEECKVMLHHPECFNEWHKKQNPKSPLV